MLKKSKGFHSRQKSSAGATILWKTYTSVAAAARQQQAAVRPADPRPVYDHARYCAVLITALLFLDKPRAASSSIAHSCNCEFAAISRYVSEMVQASELL